MEVWFPMKIEIRRDVLTLSLPIFAEQFFVNLMGMVNTIMAGRIGKEAVSAIGMVDSINSVLQACFSALAVGGTVVVAHYVGQGNRRMAGEATLQALASGLLIATLFSLLVWLFKAPLLSAIFSTAEPQVMRNMQTYLGITLLGYPLVAVALIASGTLRGAGDTKTPMKANTLMNVLNVILSYLFIYGLHLKNSHFTIDFPGFGVAGAAIGITLSRAVGTLYVLYSLVRGTGGLRLRGVSKFRFDWDIQRSIFGIGVPSSVEALMMQGGKLLTQIMVVSMGTVAIAANYIAFSIVMLINIPGNALSVAATTLVGQSMGRGDKQGATSTLWYVIKFATVALVGLGLLCIPFTSWLASLYSTDPEVIAMASLVVRINCCFMLFWATTFVLPSGLKGAGDAKYAMATTLIGMFLFRLILGYVLGVVLDFGLVGVWFGMFFDWIVRSILYVLRLRSGKWLQNQVIKKTTVSN